MRRRNPRFRSRSCAPAVESMQKRQLAKAKAAFEKASAENKTKSDAFLAQNKAKAGVKTLPSGVQYRVVENGTGAKPSQTSNIQIQYKGNIPNGPTFVDTFTAQQGQPAGPVTMKLSQIPLVGLREALTQMPIRIALGSRASGRQGLRQHAAVADRPEPGRRVRRQARQRQVTQWPVRAAHGFAIARAGMPTLSPRKRGSSV